MTFGCCTRAVVNGCFYCAVLDVLELWSLLGDRTLKNHSPVKKMCRSSTASSHERSSKRSGTRPDSEPFSRRSICRALLFQSGTWRWRIHPGCVTNVLVNAFRPSPQRYQCIASTSPTRGAGFKTTCCASALASLLPLPRPLPRQL